MDAPPFDPVRHRRGGRRRKPEGERRDIGIRVRLSPEELAGAKERAKAAGMSMAAFGRAALNNTPISLTVVKEAPPEIVFQLRAMGNNLNQALYEARAGNFTDPNTEAALVAAAQTIASELRTVLHGPERH